MRRVALSAILLIFLSASASAETDSQRLAKDLATAHVNLEVAAKRNGGAAVAAYRAAATAAQDALQVDPGNAEAKAALAEAQSKLRALVGELDGEALESLRQRCRKQVAAAKKVADEGTVNATQNGIKEYEKVQQLDPTEQTDQPTVAREAIRALKSKLHEGAAPFVERSDDLVQQQDWGEARRAIRHAIEIDPYDAGLEGRFDKIEHECLVRAAEKIQEARRLYDSGDAAGAQKAALEARAFVDAHPTVRTYEGNAVERNLGDFPPEPPFKRQN